MITVAVEVWQSIEILTLKINKKANSKNKNQHKKSTSKRNYRTSDVA